MTCQQAHQTTNNGMFSKNYMPNGCALYNVKLRLADAILYVVITTDTGGVVAMSQTPTTATTSHGGQAV